MVRPGRICPGFHRLSRRGRVFLYLFIFCVILCAIFTGAFLIAGLVKSNLGTLIDDAADGRSGVSTHFRGLNARRSYHESQRADHWPGFLRTHTVSSSSRSWDTLTTSISLLAKYRSHGSSWDVVRSRPRAGPTARNSADGSTELSTCISTALPPPMDHTTPRRLYCAKMTPATSSSA